MKRKLTVTKNRKYVVSTVKVTDGLYETAIFGIDITETPLWCPDLYDIDYYREMERFNFSTKREAIKCHRIAVKYWSI